MDNNIILYLYAEVMGYTIATMRELRKSGYEVHVVHWRDRTKTLKDVSSEIKFYQSEECDDEALHSLYLRLKPKLVIISGWMDKKYLRLAKRVKLDAIPVVVAFDTQWRGTIKQRITVRAGGAWLRKNYCTHAWVPGIPQYELARKMGFNESNIIADLYSADTCIYKYNNNDFFLNKNTKYPHKFMFVGRYELEKGVDILTKAWSLVANRCNDWEVHTYGQGSLKISDLKIPRLTAHEYTDSANLARISERMGCFVLPSRYEPWGVVIHEFTSVGLPIIASSAVGATRTFLIDGFNGFSIRGGCVTSLASRLSCIANMADADLFKMAQASIGLSHRITPQSSAMNLLSVIQADRFCRA